MLHHQIILQMIMVYFHVQKEYMKIIPFLLGLHFFLLHSLWLHQWQSWAFFLILWLHLVFNVIHCYGLRWMFHSVLHGGFLPLENYSIFILFLFILNHIKIMFHVQLVAFFPPHGDQTKEIYFMTSIVVCSFVVCSSTLFHPTVWLQVAFAPWMLLIMVALLLHQETTFASRFQG